MSGHPGARLVARSTRCCSASLAIRASFLPGMNYKDQPGLAQKFLDRFGNPFAAIGVDPDGPLAIDWGVYGVPETFVIGKDGKIAAQACRPAERSRDAQELMPQIEKALAAKVRECGGSSDKAGEPRQRLSHGAMLAGSARIASNLVRLLADQRDLQLVAGTEIERHGAQDLASAAREIALRGEAWTSMAGLPIAASLRHQPVERVLQPAGHAMRIFRRRDDDAVGRRRASISRATSGGVRSPHRQD